MTAAKSSPRIASSASAENAGEGSASWPAPAASIAAATAGSASNATAFAAMPEEIRLRLLLRAIDRFGHEGPAELGKVEALLSALDRAVAEKTAASRPKLKRTPRLKLRLKQTLAGALVSLIGDRISITPAPPRRRGRAG